MHEGRRQRGDHGHDSENRRGDAAQRRAQLAEDTACTGYRDLQFAETFGKCGEALHGGAD